MRRGDGAERARPAPAVHDAHPDHEQHERPGRERELEHQ